MMSRFRVEHHLHPAIICHGLVFDVRRIRNKKAQQWNCQIQLSLVCNSGLLEIFPIIETRGCLKRSPNLNFSNPKEIVHALIRNSKLKIWPFLRQPHVYQTNITIWLYCRHTGFCVVYLLFCIQGIFVVHYQSPFLHRIFVHHRWTWIARGNPYKLKFYLP